MPRVTSVSTEKTARTVHGPVPVRFRPVRDGVAPGRNRGGNHRSHTLRIDAPLPAMDQPLPKDDTHLHVGKGQTETVLTLAPGKHTLQRCWPTPITVRTIQPVGLGKKSPSG